MAENEITKERINELFRDYFFNRDALVTDIENLSYTELILITANAEKFITPDSAPVYNPKDNTLTAKTSNKEDILKRKIFFYKILTEKLKNAPELYFIYGNVKNFPFIDNNGIAWLFTDMEKAQESIEKYFSADKEFVFIKKAENKDFPALFESLHKNGYKHFRINASVAAINAEDIFPKNDYTYTEGDFKKLANPSLCFAELRFLQRRYSKEEYEKKAQEINYFVTKMCFELLDGKFIMPVIINEKAQVEEGKLNISIPYLKREDGTKWTPAFTDFDQFAQMYKGHDMKFVVNDFVKLAEASNVPEIDGIAIDPQEINNAVNKSMVSAVLKLSERLSAFKNEIRLGSRLVKTAEFPEDMLSELKKETAEYFKGKSAVRKIFAHYAYEASEFKYIFVIDFDGDKDVFADYIEKHAIGILKGKVEVLRADENLSPLMTDGSVIYDYEAELAKMKDEYMHILEKINEQRSISDKNKLKLFGSGKAARAEAEKRLRELTDKAEKLKKQIEG